VDRRRALSRILERSASPEARAELERVTTAPFDAAHLLATFTALDRRAGKAVFSISPEERADLGPTAITSAGELARVMCLLFAEDRAPSGTFAAFFRRAYDDGDNRERIAVLRALPFLARPEDVLPTAIESTRTHVVPIFEALACENPYPAAHFPDLNFNQMALKAAFVGVELARIVGLAKRRTPDLARMARDYAAERRAAGRSVPSDLDLLEEPS
jgi:hypothetical protein